MDLDGQYISAPIPAPMHTLQGPWSELDPRYPGQSVLSGMLEEGTEFQQSLSYPSWTLSLMQATYEEEQRREFHTSGQKAHANYQHHPQSLFATSNSAYRQDGCTNTGTPGSPSSGSPASSTNGVTYLPGRRKGPLSPSGRQNARKMRKKGSCFRCVVMREKCVIDESKDDGICERCRGILNDRRTWNLPCSQLKLRDRLRFMLPDFLTSHLRACKVREYIEANTNGSVNGSAFKLEIEIGFDTPLVLDAVEFHPRGQEKPAMRGFQLTTTGSSTSVILYSPPIIPVLLSKCAIWLHIRNWVQSIISGDVSDFPEQCFPEFHEQWQRDILREIWAYSQTCISKSETQEGRAFYALRRALELVVLNHIMCHAFTVPEDKVESLCGQLRNYRPTGPLEWVCPRVVNKVIKSYCLPMLKEVNLAVLEDLHDILRSTTLKEALWDQAFSIVFLCLITIGKNQVAVLERAEACEANGDDSLTLDDAVNSIEEMEIELAKHLIEMFHHRFSTRKKGNGNGKPFNPLAADPPGPSLKMTSLMEVIRNATERHGRLCYCMKRKAATANNDAGWNRISAAAKLPLIDLLDLDNMKARNVQRLLCKFMSRFAPQDV